MIDVLNSAQVRFHQKNIIYKTMKGKDSGSNCMETVDLLCEAETSAPVCSRSSKSIPHHTMINTKPQCLVELVALLPPFPKPRSQSRASILILMPHLRLLLQRPIQLSLLPPLILLQLQAPHLCSHPPAQLLPPLSLSLSLSLLLPPMACVYRCCCGRRRHSSSC
jgi:hypothetical protein